MPLCSNCNSSVSSLSKFCTHCGTKLNVVNSSVSLTSSSTRNLNSSPSKVTSSTVSPSVSSSSSPQNQSLSSSEYSSLFKSGTITFCVQCGEPVLGKSCKNQCAGGSDASDSGSPHGSGSFLMVSSSVGKRSPTATAVSPVVSSSSSVGVTSSRKCLKCGTLNEKKFCTRCGEKIEDLVASPSSSTSVVDGLQKSPISRSMSSTEGLRDHSKSRLSSEVSKRTTSPNNSTLSKPQANVSSTRAHDSSSTAPATGTPCEVSPSTRVVPVPPSQPRPSNAIQRKPPPPPVDPPPLPPKPKSPINEPGAKRVPPPPPSTKKPVRVSSGMPNADLQRLQEENEHLKSKLLEFQRVHHQSLVSSVPVSDTASTEHAAATNSTATDGNAGASASGTSEEGTVSEPERRRTWRQKYDTWKGTNKSIQRPSMNESLGTTGPTLGSFPIERNFKRSTRQRSASEVSLGPRDLVVREIIDTEEDYVADLEIIVKEFLIPMREKELATKEEITGIFSNLEIILGLNKLLLSDLKKNEGKSIGETFIRMADYLKMYATFCNNQQTSFAIINKLKEKKDKKFESYLAYCFLNPSCLGLDFNSYMIKPVQRICKYPLLLKELISKTEEQHEEYHKLKVAYMKIEEIVLAINERKRESENTQKVYEISKLVINGENYNLITPSRRYIKEGELQHFDSKMKLKEGYYFLFNDLFLYTKRRGNKFLVKTRLPLEQAEIRYVSTYDKPTFELVSTDKSWPMVLANEEEKIKFVEDLQDLIDKAILGSSSADQSKRSRSGANDEDSFLFDCQYYDHRTIRFPKSTPLAYNVFYWGIAQGFNVDGITIMYEDKLISSQEELDSLLQYKRPSYNLSIYDPYDSSNAMDENSCLDRGGDVELRQPKQSLNLSGETANATAIYDFSDSSLMDSLAFHTGDLITIIGEDDGSGWLYGEFNGSKGIFPATYVHRN